MGRMEQINELLRAELACLISQNISLENGLITVSRVKCSPDLSSATVYISILPENLSGTALSTLRKNNYILKKNLKKLHLKNIPKLNWQTDPQARQKTELDKVFDEIKKKS